MTDENGTLNADDFKGAMGSWAAGVTIVTTRDGDSVYGLTVSSFSSLSLDPTLILVSIQNSNLLLSMVERSRVFGVSILAQGQEEISGQLARSGREAVQSYDFPTRELVTGAPIIDGSIGYVDCELHEMLSGGDHTILVGKVVAAGYDDGKQPLLYFRRAYRTVTQ